MPSVGTHPSGYIFDTVSNVLFSGGSAAGAQGGKLWKNESHEGR